MSVTYHVVVPFDRNEEGDLVAGEAKEALNGDVARRRAQALAGTHAGAIAFSRTGNMDSGYFDHGVITASSARAPERLIRHLSGERGEYHQNGSNGVGGDLQLVCRLRLRGELPRPA